MAQRNINKASKGNQNLLLEATQSSLAKGKGKLLDRSLNKAVEKKADIHEKIKAKDTKGQKTQPGRQTNKEGSIKQTQVTVPKILRGVQSRIQTRLLPIRVKEKPCESEDQKYIMEEDILSNKEEPNSSKNRIEDPVSLIRKGLPYVDILSFCTMDQKTFQQQSLKQPSPPMRKKATRVKLSPGEEALIQRTAKQTTRQRYLPKKALSTQPEHKVHPGYVCLSPSEHPLTDVGSIPTPSIQGSQYTPNDRQDLKYTEKLQYVPSEQAQVHLQNLSSTELTNELAASDSHQMQYSMADMELDEGSGPLNKDDIKETIMGLATVSKSEFERNFREWMERDNVSRGLHAKLRADLVESFNKTKLGRIMQASSAKLANAMMPMQTLTLTPFTLALYTLVAEFLLSQNCHFTLSVFYSEVPISNTLPNFESRVDFRFLEREICDLLQALTGAMQPELKESVFGDYVKNSYSLLFALLRTLLDHYLRQKERGRDVATKMTNTEPEINSKIMNAQHTQTPTYIAPAVAPLTVTPEKIILAKYNKATNTESLSQYSPSSDSPLRQLENELNEINTTARRHLLSVMKRVHNLHEFSQLRNDEQRASKTTFERLWEQLERSVAQTQTGGIDALRLTIKNLCHCARSIEELLKLKASSESTQQTVTPRFILKLDAGVQTQETDIQQLTKDMRNMAMQTLAPRAHSMYTETNALPVTINFATQTERLEKQATEPEKEKSYEQWVGEMCDSKSGMIFLERLEQSMRKALTIQKTRYAKMYEIKLRHERELLKIRYKRKSMERICRRAAADTSGEVRLLVDQMSKQMSEYEMRHSALLEKIHATEVAAHSAVQTLQPIQQQLLQAVLPPQVQKRLRQAPTVSATKLSKMHSGRDELVVERVVLKAKLRIQELENEGNDLEKNFLDSLECTRLQREAECRLDCKRERKRLQDTVSQFRQLQLRHQQRANHLAHIESSFANDLEQVKHIERKHTMPVPSAQPPPAVPPKTTITTGKHLRNAITDAKNKFFKERPLLREFISEEAHRPSHNSKSYDYDWNGYWNAKDEIYINLNETKMPAAGTEEMLRRLKAEQALDAKQMARPEHAVSHLPLDRNISVITSATTTTTATTKTTTANTTPSTSSTDFNCVEKLLKGDECAKIARTGELAQEFHLNLSMSSTSSSEYSQPHQLKVDNDIPERINSTDGKQNATTIFQEGTDSVQVVPSNRLQRSLAKMQQLFATERLEHDENNKSSDNVAANSATAIHPTPSEESHFIADCTSDSSDKTNYPHNDCNENEQGKKTVGNIRNASDKNERSETIDSDNATDEDFWSNLGKILN